METHAERLERFRGYARENRRVAEALAAAGLDDAARSYRDTAAEYAGLIRRWEREAEESGE